MCETRKACKLFKISTLIVLSIIVSLNTPTKVFATPSEVENSALILIDPGHGWGDTNINTPSFM